MPDTNVASPSQSGLPPDEVIFGHSGTMMEVRRRAEKIAVANIPVLLFGAPGTGKETIARWIHERSNYRGGQFVKVNCAAIPKSLLESELFGYEKGSFTGAHGAKPGRVEMAHGGSLFLDEIADLDIALQSKLLHFLQDGRFSRIGDESERAVDARVICSTNRDLAREIEQGRFRADLFYRIGVVQLQLPPLRERIQDIPLIADYLRLAYEKQFAKETFPLSACFCEELQNLSWPGNLRELANGMARYVLLGPENAISVEPSRLRGLRPSKATGTTGIVPLKRISTDAVRELERNVILETLREHQWNRRKTAMALKISYRALIYKIRNAGLVSNRVTSNPQAGR